MRPLGHKCARSGASFRSWCALVVVVFGLCTVSGCRARTESPGGEPGVPRAETGEEIVVWDMRQPHFPGIRPYEEEVQRICAGFEEATGFCVKMTYVTRWDFPRALAAALKEGKAPDVVFAGEFPSRTGLEKDLTPYLNPAEFQRPSLEAWTVNGQVIGVPAAFLWLGVAVRKDAVEAVPEDAGQLLSWAGETSGALMGSLAIFPSSQAFVCMTLEDTSGRPRTAAEISTYLSWLKSRAVRPATGGWVEEFRRGELKGLYAVTPYMFRWLKITSQPGAPDEPRLFPMALAEDRAGFGFTVPGYVVLSEDSRKVEASAELAKMLAQAYGRWAARALAMVPARVEDLPVFTLESGLTREERAMLVNSLDSRLPLLIWPEAEKAGRDSSVPVALQDALVSLAGAFSGYFSGNLSDAELAGEIARAIGGNTTR